MAGPSVAIVGGGFAGIGAAVMLRREGYDDVTVFERGDRIGGVWNFNTYPGIACDIPSHLYEFSFAPNSDWSRRFSPGHEIREYMEDGGAQPRRARQGAAAHRGHGRRVRRGPVTLGARHIGGPPRGGRAADGVRSAVHAAGPADPRPRRLRRAGVPHRPLARRRGSRRKARCPRGHRLQRHPDRPVDPAGGGPARRLPALAGLDAPEERLRVRAARTPALPPLPADPPARSPAGLPVHGDGHDRHDPASLDPEAVRRGWAAGRSTPRSRTPSCGGRSRRRTRSAASGSCSPTTGTRPSRSRTST